MQYFDRLARCMAAAGRQDGLNNACQAALRHVHTLPQYVQKSNEFQGG